MKYCNQPSAPSPGTFAAPLLDSFEQSPNVTIRWIRVGTLFDAARDECLPQAHLVFDRDTILYAGTDAPSPELTAGAELVDLPDAMALPGLFDAHTHISMNGSTLDPDQRTKQQAQPPEILLTESIHRAAALARLAIVGMRDGGDKDGVGLALSQRFKDSKGSDLPRILSPGAGIHRQGRYGSFFSRPLEEHPSMIACVAERIQLGADHVKIVPTGIINFAKGTANAKPQFTAAEIAEAKAASSAAGRQLMAHASGEAGIQIAIEGGVDTIEHGYFLTRYQLGMMRDKGIAWVPTFAPVWRQLVHADVMGWDAPICDNLRRILDAHRQSLQDALSIGVTLLVGSDAGSCGVAHGAGILDEMHLMEEAGMPARTVLSQTCYGNEQTLAPGSRRPSLCPGAPAIFILAPRDTLQQTTGLESAFAISQNGIQALSQMRTETRF